MGFNLKSLIYFFAFLAAATAVILLAPYVLDRALTGAEFSAIALAIAVVLARLSLLARRRQRQNLEGMRDSALW
jgi:hypothetical protein